MLSRTAVHARIIIQPKQKSRLTEKFPGPILQPREIVTYFPIRFNCFLRFRPSLSTASVSVRCFRLYAPCHSPMITIPSMATRTMEDGSMAVSKEALISTSISPSPYPIALSSTVV